METTDFAKRLKLLRIAREISVEKICESLDIDEKTYYKYEKGTSCPNAKTVVDICSVLVCDANKLLGFPDKDPNQWSDYATRSAQMIDNMPLASRKVGLLILGMLHLNAAVKNSLSLSGGIDINDLVSELSQ